MDARETRKEKRREQVRDEILEATRRVLLTKGLSGFTLSAVAREVHLTKAALYYYFPSKEALVFEMIYIGLGGHAAAVGGALASTTSGAAAIETLIRSSAAHYSAHMDDLRLAYLVPQVGSSDATLYGPEMLARIRPFNDQIYGTAAEKIRADQRANLIDTGIDGRRFAFLAHTAVIGLLTVEGAVEAADNVPLIHAHAAMIDDLVGTFTARLTGP